MHQMIMLFVALLLLSQTEAVPGNGNGGDNGNGGGNGNGNGKAGSAGEDTGTGKFRFAPSDRKRKDKQNCFIVKLKDGATSDKKKTLFDQTDGTDGTLFEHALHGFVKCNVQLAQMKKLADDDDVDTIEEDQVVDTGAVQTTGTSAGSGYWHLDRIDQATLPLNNQFNYQYTGQGVTVYILDSGVNGAHQDFAGRMGTGKDIYDFGAVNPATDCNGHGTHCAGLAAGTLSGVAKLATIVPVRVLGCDGGGTSSTVINGINWVMTQPRGVLSLSLGAGFSSTMNNAVANAVAANYIVVVAAGNSACDACTISPASAPDAITVASVGSSDTQSSWSDFGSCVDVYAPGENCLSASNTDNAGFVLKSGTSMATPIVAGVVAAYLSGNPSLTAQQMNQVIINEATPGVVRSATAGTPNLLVKSSGTPNLNSRSPSRSPVSASPSPSPLVPSPSPITPRNDFCGNSAWLACGTTVKGTTKNANFNPTGVTCTVTHTAPEVWYTIYIPTAGQITASLCSGTSFDTKLTLWSGTCVGTDVSRLACVAGNDDACSLQSTVIATLNPGQYFLMVHGYRSLTGDFSLSLTCPAGTPVVQPSPGYRSVEESPITPVLPPGTIPTTPTAPTPRTPAADAGVKAALYGLTASTAVLFGFIVGVTLIVCLMWYCIWPKISSLGIWRERFSSMDTTSDVFPPEKKVSIDDSEIGPQEILLGRGQNVLGRAPAFREEDKPQSAYHIGPTQSVASYKGRRGSAFYPDAEQQMQS